MGGAVVGQRWRDVLTDKVRLGRLMGGCAELVEQLPARRLCVQTSNVRFKSAPFNHIELFPQLFDRLREQF